jgi:hypothetical protein
MDTLTVAFDRFSSRNTVSPAVKHGIQRGQNLLDKYYSKTDETVMYRVAIRKHFGPKKITRTCRDSQNYSLIFSPSSRLPGQMDAETEVGRVVDS